MPGGNVRPDPLDVLWIEMSMRQLTNHALGLYLADAQNLPAVKGAVRDFAAVLQSLGVVTDPHRQCPTDFEPCPGNPKSCCPDIMRG